MPVVKYNGVGISPRDFDGLAIVNHLLGPLPSDSVEVHCTRQPGKTTRCGFLIPLKLVKVVLRQNSKREGAW